MSDRLYRGEQNRYGLQTHGPYSKMEGTDYNLFYKVP